MRPDDAAHGDPGVGGRASDADEYRAENLTRWEASAAGWERRRESFQAVALPVSRWLVEASHPQPGHRVLELAAGPGDTGLLAAELIAPGGILISSDAAEPMLDVARRRATELGIDNVEFRVLDAEWIDLPTADVDGVLCRWGYMLLADPDAALGETRRVLRPGGRIALATWAAPEHNPFFTIRGQELRRRGLGGPPPAPDAPGPFALSDPHRVSDRLAGAGFTGILVEELPITFRFASFEELWDTSRDLGVELRRITHAAGPEVTDDLRQTLATAYEPFTAADGSLAVPGLVLVAAADA